MVEESKAIGESLLALLQRGLEVGAAEGLEKGFVFCSIPADHTHLEDPFRFLTLLPAGCDRNLLRKRLIFDIKALVSYMSSCMSLHPGDICCTGTPPGVGENMSPPHFLKGGEEVVLGVDKLGTQKHQVLPYKD